MVPKALSVVHYLLDFVGRVDNASKQMTLKNLERILDVSEVSISLHFYLCLRCSMKFWVDSYLVFGDYLMLSGFLWLNYCYGYSFYMVFSAHSYRQRVPAC